MSIVACISFQIGVFVFFPCGSAGKESTCNAGDLGSIPGLGRSPGEGNDNPLQCFSLENSIDSIIHGVTKSQTRLSELHSFLQINIQEWDCWTIR